MAWPLHLLDFPIDYAALFIIHLPQRDRQTSRLHEQQDEELWDAPHMCGRCLAGCVLSRRGTSDCPPMLSVVYNLRFNLNPPSNCRPLHSLSSCSLWLNQFYTVSASSLYYWAPLPCLYFSLLVSSGSTPASFPCSPTVYSTAFPLACSLFSWHYSCLFCFLSCLSCLFYLLSPVPSRVQCFLNARCPLQMTLATCWGSSSCNCCLSLPLPLLLQVQLQLLPALAG